MKRQLSQKKKLREMRERSEQLNSTRADFISSATKTKSTILRPEHKYGIFKVTQRMMVENGPSSQRETSMELGREFKILNDASTEGVLSEKADLKN